MIDCAIAWGRRVNIIYYSESRSPSRCRVYLLIRRGEERRARDAKQTSLHSSLFCSDIYLTLNRDLNAEPSCVTAIYIAHHAPTSKHDRNQINAFVSPRQNTQHRARREWKSVRQCEKSVTEIRLMRTRAFISNWFPPNERHEYRMHEIQCLELIGKVPGVWGDGYGRKIAYSMGNCKLQITTVYRDRVRCLCCDGIGAACVCALESHLTLRTLQSGKQLFVHTERAATVTAMAMNLSSLFSFYLHFSLLPHSRLSLLFKPFEMYIASEDCPLNLFRCSRNAKAQQTRMCMQRALRMCDVRLWLRRNATAKNSNAISSPRHVVPSRRFRSRLHLCQCSVPQPRHRRGGAKYIVHREQNWKTRIAARDLSPNKQIT